MYIFKFLLFLVSIILFNSSITAQDKNQETTLEWRTRVDDPKISNELLKAEVERLSGIQTSRAKGRLAYLYIHGLGVDTDLDKAVSLLKSADSEDDPFAHYLVGYFFEHGLLNVPKDIGQAAGRYETAAKNGDVFAQYALAQIYHYGKEYIKKDLIQAVKWYEKSAAQGKQDVFKHLGDIYFHEFKDLKNARKWYGAACETENKGSESCNSLKEVNTEIHYSKIKTFTDLNNPEWQFVPSLSTSDKKYYVDLRLLENDLFHENIKQVLIRINYAEPKERYGKEYTTAIFAWLFYCESGQSNPNFVKYFNGNIEIESDRINVRPMKIGDEEDLNYIINEVCN